MEVTREGAAASKVRGASFTGRPVFRFGASWIAAVLLYVIGVVVSPGLFSGSEITDLLQVASFTGIVALGETVVMLTGGIDLSIPGVIILSDSAVAIASQGRNGALVVALGVALGLALLCGVINGLLVAYLRISGLVATLATGSVYTGLILLYTGGSPEGAVPASLAEVGQGRIVIVPYDALIWLGITCVLWLSLRRSSWGKGLYAVGASPLAAVVTGVKTRAITCSAYVVSGLLAGCTGVVLAAYAATPSLTVGSDYLLAPIAAAAVGGTLLTGGIGSAWGTAGGSLFLTMAIVLATVLHVSSNVSYVIEGAIILVSVGLYSRGVSSVLTRE